MAISTRLHGWIDYAAAISLGGIALVGGLPGPARRVAAVATAVPICAFLLTDFEAGLIGLIGVRRHSVPGSQCNGSHPLPVPSLLSTASPSSFSDCRPVRLRRAGPARVQARSRGYSDRPRV